MSSHPIIQQDSFLLAVLHWLENTKAMGIDVNDLTPEYVIYDLLQLAGIPEGGIRLVLPELVDENNAEAPLQPMPCSICQEPAVALAESQRGNAYTVCQLHGDMASAQGLTVILPAVVTIQ